MREEEILKRYRFDTILNTGAGICLILAGLYVMFGSNKKEMAEQTAKLEKSAEPKAKLEIEAAPMPFEKFIAEHQPNARTLKEGDTFLLDDGQTPVKIDGQPVSYGGTDDLMLVIRYMKSAKLNNRTYQSPLILPLPVKPIPGGPATKIAGDVTIGDYVIHILWANGQECEYAVTKKPD